MLFDCDPKLVRDMMKSKRVTGRDVKVKKVDEDTNNPLVYVAAKTPRGLEFVREIMCKIPRVETEAPPDEDPDETEEEEEEDEDEEEEEEEEEEEPDSYYEEEEEEEEEDE